MSTRSFLAFLAVAAVIALLAFGLLSKGGASISVGDPVPDAELPRLDGKGTGEIADYRGKWVLVNLWASWCPPCRQESPALEEFWKRHRRDGIQVVGINVQDNGEDAAAFVADEGLTYPQLRSVGNDRSEAFGTSGVPESFLVDPKGRLALIWRSQLDADFLREQVLPLTRSSS